jgi:hypothetical protein
VGNVNVPLVVSISKNLTIEGSSSATLTGTSGNRILGFSTPNRTITFSNITFTGASITAGSGGAMDNYQASNTITFTNCTFSNNTAPVHSGAVHVGQGNFTFNSCTFSNNSVTGTGQGGAISILNPSIGVFNNCTFTSNTSNAFGGSIWHNGTGTVTITNSTFTNNSAKNGGAFYDQSVGGSTISGSLFSGNAATAGSAGAIYSDNTTDSATPTIMTISNSTIANNTATGSGGAMFIKGIQTNAFSFTNVSFYGNTSNQTSAAFGGGIRIEGTGARPITFTNCLFNNNTTAGSGAGPLSSDVWAEEPQALTFNNCILQNFLGNSINTTGSNNDVNSGSTFLEDLSESSLSFVSPNVTFSAPPSIANPTPIDFGNNGEDIGAWNSNINIFKGTTNSDWATAGNWSGIVPTATDNVTILADSPAVVIGATTGAVANNLSVNAGSSLTINAGGSLIVSGTSTGNVTYNRTLTAVAGDANGWHLIASPVAGQAYNNAYATTNDLATSTTDASRRGLATFNDANNPKYNYLLTNDSNAGTFTSGIGYSAKRASTGTVAFTGTINTSDVNSVAVSTGGNGYNLLGNPYTSYMSSQTFLNANTNTTGNIWTWTHGSGYTSRPAGDNFILAPGQGFFVDVTSGTTVNFAESNQSSGTDNFQKTSKTEINLTINDGTLNRNARVYYLDNNVTDGLDWGYEGKLFGAVNHDLAIYSQLLSDASQDKYQVQALPNSDFESKIIPLGVKASAGKEIMISAEVSNLPSDIKVFLEDRVNNTFTRLDENNSNFTITLTEALDGVGRFYLHTKSSSLSISDNDVLNSVRIFKSDVSTLRIAGLSQGKASVSLYNILGKRVLTTSFAASSVQDITLPKLATGIYIVQLETETGKLNKKITLE